MIYVLITAGVLILLVGAFLINEYIIYRDILCIKRKSGPSFGNYSDDEKSRQAKALHKKKMEEFNALPAEDVEITSYDGLRLRGKYFCSSGSEKAVIFFHGYRSRPESDGAAVTKFFLDRGYNVLTVHQRSHGVSEGSAITFGVKERYDCLSWVDYAVGRLGKDAKLILMGVSMGASTVMMASDLNIPSVKGIIADCGFSSPEGIFRVIIKRLGYPVKLAYFLLRTAAQIFGGFDPEKASAIEALANSDIPITIIHSDTDGYVPCYMAHECYDAAKAKNKKLIIISDANHAYSYYYDKEKYEEALSEMINTVENN